MKNTGIKKKAGFTLVEMVLVVGLLAISFGVTSDILISLVRSQTKSRVMNGIEQQANFVSLSIEKELRNAVSVRRPHVSIGGSTIIIERRNGEEVEISVNESGLITFTDPLHGGSYNLTDNTSPGGVNVTGSFSLSDTGVFPVVVGYNLVFTSSDMTGNVPSSETYTISNTVVVRSTY